MALPCWQRPGFEEERLAAAMHCVSVLPKTGIVCINSATDTRGASCREAQASLSLCPLNEAGSLVSAHRNHG